MAHGRGSGLSSLAVRFQGACVGRHLPLEVPALRASDSTPLSPRACVTWVTSDRKLESLGRGGPTAPEPRGCQAETGKEKLLGIWLTWMRGGATGTSPRWRQRRPVAAVFSAEAPLVPSVL